MVLGNESFNATSPDEYIEEYVKPVKSLQPFQPSEIFVSNEIRKTTEIIGDLCFTFLLANVGIVSNIIIIVVFYKQGFKESMNVSMTAIAIWDLVKCVAASMERMSGPISLVSGANSETWTNITTVAISYLICFATYTSSVQAAYVAVERCLCVSMPLLVKTLLTPKITLIAMSSISVIVFGSFVVMFGIYDVIWVYSPKWNETIAVFHFSTFHKIHEGPLTRYYNLIGVLWPTVSFIVIIICTIIIAYQLRKASTFRSQSQATTRNSTIQDRDKQVVKMLVVIIAIYAINLFPRIILFMTKYFIYELYFLRKYHNTFNMIRYFIAFFDVCNATVNLYVFLTMSSNFKATAKEMFSCGGKK